MANKRHVRLDSLKDARIFITKLINGRFREEIDTQMSRDLGYLIKIFCEVYSQSELEMRIQALEKAVKNNQTGSDYDGKKIERT
jgi:hypothetical protein